MPPAPADEQTLERHLLSLDDTRHAAMVASDCERLGMLLSEGLVYTHSTGVTETRAQYLDALRSGRVKYIRMYREIEHFHAWSSCAVFQGRLDFEAQVDGRPYLTRALFTSTWVEDCGHWVMAAWAATREKDEVP